MKLTVRQKAFADYYLECGNASEAARKAGYSEKTAPGTGAENLKKPQIAQYIAERLAEIEDKRIATVEEVMVFYTSVLRGEVKDAFDLEASLESRMEAGKELMKRYNASADKNQASMEKLDGLLKEFKDAVIG